MRLFPLFFRLVHRNCLIFGTKVNLGNTYTLEILKFFGRFLVCRETQHRALVQLFSRLAHQNCLIFCSKVNLANTYKFAIFIFLGKFLIPSNPLNPLKRSQNEVFSTFHLIGSLELSNFWL